MRRWLALAGLLAAATAGAADDAALRTLDACRAKLDSKVDIGFERIERRCPDLRPALERAAWRDLLPRHMPQRREEVTAASLAKLAELVRQAQVDPALRPPPSLQGLAPVLAELGAQGQEGATGWERLKRWLEDKLENRTEDKEATWLENLRRQLRTSEGVAQVFTWAGRALVLALVVFIVVSEVRAAGVFRRRRAESERSGPAAQWRRRLMLADVNAAPLAERPGMLLRLVGEALTRTHRLPAAEGLTASTIVQRAALEQAADRASLAGIARTADTVRYAARPPADDALESAVTAGKELLARVARQSSGQR